MTTQALDSRAIPAPRTVSRVWAGRIVSALPILFLTVDGGMKLANPAPVREAMGQLGWPLDMAPTLGVILLACVALYAIPRTAVLGAILLTGYFGGAIATHVRLGQPLFSHSLFPLYIAVFVWAGLYLRDERVRALFGRP